MRLPVSFSRYKTSVPAGGIVIGTDAVPNAAAGADGTAPGRRAAANTASAATVVGDNFLTSPYCSNSGWPMHRVAVSYNYRGGGSAVALPATLWVWDWTTRRWYQTTTANLVNDKVTFFDVAALLDQPVSAAFPNQPSAGSLEAVLIVTDPPAPDGEHRFGMGADLSLF